MSEYTWAWIFATIAAAICTFLGLEAPHILFGFAFTTVLVAILDLITRSRR